MEFVGRDIKRILYIILCPRGGGARRGKMKIACEEKKIYSTLSNIVLDQRQVKIYRVKSKNF